MVFPAIFPFHKLHLPHFFGKKFPQFSGKDIPQFSGKKFPQFSGKKFPQMKHPQIFMSSFNCRGIGLHNGIVGM
jgi:hypothetical protein